MVTFHIIIRLGSAVQNVIDSNPGLKVNYTFPLSVSKQNSKITLVPD